MGAIKLPWREQLLLLTLSDKSTINVLLSLASVLSAIGLYFTTPRYGNYNLLLEFASQYVWATIFLVHGIVCIARALGRCSEMLHILNLFYGLWIWSYVSVSFMIMDDTPIAPFEFTLLSFLVSEVWLLACSMLTISAMRSANKGGFK